MNFQYVDRPTKLPPVRYRDLIESLDKIGDGVAIEVSDVDVTQIPRIRFALWMHYGKGKVKTKYYKHENILRIWRP
jgi:hypothetical protein